MEQTKHWGYTYSSAITDIELAFEQGDILASTKDYFISSVRDVFEAESTDPLDKYEFLKSVLGYEKLLDKMFEMCQVEDKNGRIDKVATLEKYFSKTTMLEYCDTSIDNRRLVKLGDITTDYEPKHLTEMRDGLSQFDRARLSSYAQEYYGYDKESSERPSRSMMYKHKPAKEEPTEPTTKHFHLEK